MFVEFLCSNFVSLSEERALSARKRCHSSISYIYHDVLCNATCGCYFGGQFHRKVQVSRKTLGRVNWFIFIEVNLVDYGPPQQLCLWLWILILGSKCRNILWPKSVYKWDLRYTGQYWIRPKAFTPFQSHTIFFNYILDRYNIDVLFCDTSAYVAAYVSTYNKKNSLK